jgi:hypothetical protein
MRFPTRALLLVLFLAAAATAGAATVTGTVRNASGTPLSGMVVAAYDASGALSGTATTDATGLYVLTVPSGSYRVLAYDLSGIYATTFDNNAESFETSPLRSIGNSGAQISFTLVRGGTITGNVQSASGVPRANMAVEAYNLSGTRRGFTTTDAAGDYTLVLPPGDYKLVAFDPNGALAPKFYLNARSFAEATPLPVTESDTNTAFFTLAPAGVISGTAIDAGTGLPLNGVLVYAYTPAGALVATTTTDASGAYDFALPAGDYKLVAADNARVYATAYYGGSRSFEASTIVDVGAGEQRGGFQLALARGVRISGHVNAPNLVIGAYNLDGTLHASSTSDSNGNYTLVVVPGDYRIAVSDPALGFATLFYGGESHFRNARTVNVTGDLNAIDVTLQRGGRIGGIVRDANNSAPLAGITVAAYDASGLAVSSATTGADGRYALVVAPGAYRVVAFDPGLNYATSYNGGASSYETTGPVAVAANAQIAADFTMRRGVRVSGSVTTSAGSPVNGVEVFALDASGNRVAGAVTSNGEFTIVLTPGTYRFVAIDPLGRFPAGAPTAAVTIVQGQQPPLIDLTLQSLSRRRSVRH